ATVAYLLMLQQADGSFGVAAKGEPNSGDIQSTSSALRALKYFGGAVKDPKVTAKFVQSCFDKTSGEIGLRPNDTRNVFTTSVGLMAMVELKMPTELYFDKASKYLTENAKSFEDIRIAAAAFETIGKRPPKAEAWLAEIAKLRNADG